MVGIVLGALAGPVAGQQRGVDVRSYEVGIVIPDSGSSVTAWAAITFRRVPSSDDTLRLDLVGLSVDSVRESRSGHLLRFAYDGRLLKVLIGGLPDPQDADEEDVVVFYHGLPRDGLLIGSNARGKRSAFADNWPERARYWLPTVDHPSDKAGIRFHVGVPDGWRVVAPGYDEGCRRRRSDARWFCEWLQTAPIPAYTMVIAAGEFTVSLHRPVINGRDTIPIEVWTYPEDSAYADSVPFRRATEIVEVMQRLIGPYPYENLKHVQSSTRFGGMENSSAIFYAEKPYVERKMGEGVVRHETAHQWFGDAVTERDWPDLWLSEGFATYFDGVIEAALDGDSTLARHMRKNAEDYFASNVTDRPIVDSANAGDPMKLLNANSYPKGAWVLHMLRELMGDSAFFHGLRAYYQTYRDSTATSEDFQHVMERAAAAKLSWFFQQWLHQAGYPQLDVNWQYEAGAGRVVVGITQRQKPQWGLFRLPVVTLEFRGTNGAILRRDVSMASARETVARVAVPFAPAEVRVDPEGKLLLKVIAIGRR